MTLLHQAPHPARNAPQDELDALVGLYSAARLDQALALVASLIERHPDCEIAHNLAGVILAASGRPEHAVVLYDSAIVLAPDYAEAYNNRGNALKDLKRHDDALASFDVAVALWPDYAEAHVNRGIVLRREKRFDEALAASGAAIRCAPRLPQAWGNRGNVLLDLHRFDEAIADYDQAIALDPHFAQAHLNRGNVLRDLGRLPEATASYDRAVALAPALALAHGNRASALKELKRLPEALAGFEQAFALDPADLTALSEMVLIQAQMGLWTDPDPRAELRRRVRAGEAVQPFHLLALADDPALQLANARRWAAAHFPEPPPTRTKALPRAQRNIRIGYFSADFYNHAVMALMIGMLERHDKARFEVHAFTYGPQRHDVVRERVVRAVDAFHDIKALDDTAAARLARSIGIDIAVDLTGYTAHGRPGIFAARAAPHQVGYLGYPGTTGASAIDYLIADKVVAPESDAAFYSERVLRLPGCYQANDCERAISANLPSRAKLGLPEDGFVFCALNNMYKITPAEFDIWMRLLAKVEGSVLWLLADNAWAVDNLKREAEARGVAARRLVFAERVAMPDHVARLARADLFLDTFAYNAHTTASEALWAGLPVVTKLGRSFAARVAGSLLHAAGLPELATESEDAYERLALSFANDPARLTGIRAKLAANRSSTALFDTERFTRDIESLFEAIAT